MYYILIKVYGVKALNGICDLFPKLSKYENPPHIELDKVPKYSVKILLFRNILEQLYTLSRSIEKNL